MSKPESPCLRCAARSPLCHSSCENYLDFRADLDLWNALQRMSKGEQEVLSYRFDVKNKLRKKYR